MKFNAEKLIRLHIDQTHGWQKARDLWSAMRFEHDRIRDLERRAAIHPVTTDAADFRRRGAEFDPHVQRQYDDLQRNLAVARATKTRLESEIERAQAEQEQRGQLLQRCVEYLRANKIDFQLPDVRPISINPQDLVSPGGGGPTVINGGPPGLLPR